MSRMIPLSKIAAACVMAIGCSQPKNHSEQHNASDNIPIPYSSSNSAQMQAIKPAVVPPMIELPAGTSQVGGLTFRATNNAAVSLISAGSDGSAHVQGSIPIEIANNTGDIVSIILAGRGVTISLNNGQTVDNAQVRGLKMCDNNIQQCTIGQKGDFVQISPVPAGGAGSGQPISVIVPFEFNTQAAGTPSLKKITSADVVGTLFLTDATGTHQESLHINNVPMKNYIQIN